MKKIECSQQKGLLKLLGCLFFVGLIIDCACMITNKNYISDGIVFGIAFGIPILLIMFGILVYKVSAIDNYIIIRKWYGRSVKFKLENITKVVMASNTGMAIDASRIHIYIEKKKILSLDPMLENYVKMKRYIINNIDDTKIDIIR